MICRQRGLSAKHGRRGGALVLSLVTVGVVAVLSMAYMQLSANVTRRQVAAVDTKMAFYLAEAGLAESYAGLMLGRTGSVGTSAAPAVHGEGLFWVESTEVSDEYLELRATGMAKSGKAVLGLVLRKGRANTGSLGVFSESSLSIPNGALIDGYDSDLGEYSVQAAADPDSVKNGRVGSNESVSIYETLGNTRVHGDVKAGPLGSVELIGRPTVSGSTANGTGAVEIPVVEVPVIAMEPGTAQTAGPPQVLASGTHGLEFLSLGENSEVILQGPMTLVLGDLSLGAGAELVFDTSAGAIELFVTGALDLNPAADLTTASIDASLVTLNFTGEAPIALQSSDAFHAFLYAPEAQIQIGAAFELFGGVVAEGLVLAPNARLHYDERLLAAGAKKALPRVAAWQILELPEGARDLVESDAFALLGVDPDLLPTPAMAHADQPLEITYVDALGVTQSYSGPEAAFDWSLVRQLLSLKRAGGIVVADIVQIAADGGLSFLL